MKSLYNVRTGYLKKVLRLEAFENMASSRSYSK